MEAADLIVNLLGGLGPVDGTHGLIQHGCEGNLGFILGNAFGAAAFELGQHGAEQISTQNCQLIQQLTGGHILLNGGLGNVNDVACVHLQGHMLSGNTGLGQAVQHRPLVGGAAPILGQKAGMDIHIAQSGNVQHPLGQDPTVGHHGANVGLQIRQGLHIRILPEAFRLEHGDIVGDGNLLHRRKDHLHAPALGPVRLGIDTDNLKAVGNDFFQAGCRNIRRTHKYYSQRITSNIAFPLRGRWHGIAVTDEV